MFEFRRQSRSLRESSSSPAQDRAAVEVPSSRGATGARPSRRAAAVSAPRELPDVTGFLVVVLVTLGLFVVPVGATIMQGPAIVASILGR